MRISHETPLKLLQNSLEFNDYQYILPTFYNKYSEYKEFMLEYRKQKNSFIILDNGLFEGDNYSDSELLKMIDEIKPDIFIVPDEWNNKTNTIVNAKSWILNFQFKIPKNTKLMAVLQGKTYGELVECYQTLVDLGYKHISFNHSSEAYFDIFPNKPKLIAQSEGRKYLIDNLLKDKILNPKLYHHLLGCSLPQEFKYYKNMDWIKSGDTSNPITVGANGVYYSEDGLDWKPKEKIECYFDINLNDKMKYIMYNIQKFKSFLI